jgi:hypothetical protein
LIRNIERTPQTIIRTVEKEKENEKEKEPPIKDDCTKKLCKKIKKLEKELYEVSR